MDAVEAVARVADGNRVRRIGCDREGRYAAVGRQFEGYGARKVLAVVLVQIACHLEDDVARICRGNGLDRLGEACVWLAVSDKEHGIRRILRCRTRRILVLACRIGESKAAAPVIVCGGRVVSELGPWSVERRRLIGLGFDRFFGVRFGLRRWLLSRRGVRGGVEISLPFAGVPKAGAVHREAPRTVARHAVRRFRLIAFP